VLGAQAAHGVFDLPPDHRPFHVISVDCHVFGQRRGRADCPSAGVIDHDVSLYGEKPRAQAAEARVEAMSCSPSSDESLLHDFFGGAGVVESLPGESEQLAPMSNEGISQSGLVSCFEGALACSLRRCRGAGARGARCTRLRTASECVHFGCSGIVARRAVQRSAQYLPEVVEVVAEDEVAVDDPELAGFATENPATLFPVTWSGALSWTKVYRGNPS